METLYFGIAVAILTAANVLISTALGWLLTEWKGPVFHFKPFSCRPCMTFWLTLGLGFYVAVLLSRGDGVTLSLLSLLAILTAFINFVYIKSQIKIEP